MSGKTKLVVVLILGTITGGYFLWRSSLWSVPDIPAYVQTAATAQGRGKQTTTEVGNLAIKENKKLTLAQDNRTDLLRIAQQDSYGKAYSQLVGVKSAEAKYLTYKIVISCAAYIGKWADATRLQIEEGSRGAALEKKLEAFNRMKRRCDGVPTEPLSHPIGSPLDITTSRDEATAMHDPRAMADGLAIRPTAFYEPHAAALAEKYAATRDPLVVASVSKYFEMRRDELFRFAPFDEGVDPMLIATVVRTAACHLGDDCSDSSPYLTAACVRYGRCEARDGDSYARLYLVTPAQQQQYETLMDIVMKGFTTQQWPNGFWRAQPRK